MTTDTRPKHGSVRFGPVHPRRLLQGLRDDSPEHGDDARLSHDRRARGAGLPAGGAERAVDRSFNLVSIDGDTSPSDTVLALRERRRGRRAIDAGSPLAASSRRPLEALCIHLAKEIARDGEGATKLIEFRVTGAAHDEEAARPGPPARAPRTCSRARSTAPTRTGAASSAVIGRSGAGRERSRR